MSPDTSRLELELPGKELDLIRQRALLWNLDVNGYVRGVLRGFIPATGGVRSRALERLRRTRGDDLEHHVQLTLSDARRTSKRGRCAVCQDATLFASVNQLREQGYSYSRIAELTRLSRNSVAHHEAHRLLSSSPKPDEAGCVVCRLGPEWGAVIIDARRKEKSVRDLAVAAGVSRSAMRWHLRDCVPAALIGLERSRPVGAVVYRSALVQRASSRFETTFPARTRSSRK